MSAALPPMGAHIADPTKGGGQGGLHGAAGRVLRRADCGLKASATKDTAPPAAVTRGRHTPTRVAPARPRGRRPVAPHAACGRRHVAGHTPTGSKPRWRRPGRAPAYAAALLPPRRPDLGLNHEGGEATATPVCDSVGNWLPQARPQGQAPAVVERRGPDSAAGASARGRGARADLRSGGAKPAPARLRTGAALSRPRALVRPPPFARAHALLAAGGDPAVEVAEGDGQGRARGQVDLPKQGVVHPRPPTSDAAPPPPRALRHPVLPASPMLLFALEGSGRARCVCWVCLGLSSL